MRTGHPSGEVRTLRGVFAPLVLVLATIGLGVLGLTLWHQVWALAWLGLLFLAGANLLHVLYLAVPRPRARVSCADHRVEVRLRPHFPLGALLAALALGAGFLTGAYPEGGAISWGYGLLALLVLLPVPDLARALLRRPRLLLDSDGLTLRGWSYDGGVRWDDVESVDLDLSRPTRPAVTIRARPGAASFRRRRRRLVTPLEPTPEAQSLTVAGIALDEPWLLLACLERMTAGSEADRRGWLEHLAVPFLTGQITLGTGRLG